MISRFVSLDAHGHRPAPVFWNFDNGNGNGNSAPTEVPLRSDIPEADRWDLTRLFPDESQYDETFAWLKENYPAITQYKGRLAESPQTLLECLELDKSLDLAIERLYHYAMLRMSEDSSDALNQSRQSKLINLLTKLSESTSFIQPELQEIPDDTYEELLRFDGLRPWRNVLRKIRRYRDHTLSHPEERLLAMASGALSGSDDAFSQLLNVDLDFGKIENEKGEQVPVTQSSLSSLLENPVRDVRERAFRKFYAGIDAHKNTLAALYANSVKTDVFQARARNYDSALNMALFPDNVPQELYENLISTVRANLDPLFRYFELRKKVLKVDDLHHFDTYLPLVNELKTEYSFEQAVDLILEALQPLGGEYVDNLGKGMHDRWVDRYESKGKRSGAFSSSSYGNPPYILMNYKPDVFSDVFTLAHEAGHSMHTWFSQKHQLFQDYDYPIFLAEVASTFNEELLTHHLLEKTDDERMRAYIINRQIDDIRGTVIRQTMFAEFEKVVHEMEEAGEALALEVFRQEYLKLLKVYFGDNFVIDEELRMECLRIPHFYRAFYVYKYATGNSAAVALSRRVLEGGEQELQDYLGFLKSGGSQYPLDTLKAAGVDMTSPQPIEATLQLFAQRVTELEDLLV